MERAMRKSVPAADPDAYFRALTGRHRGWLRHDDPQNERDGSDQAY
jgi:hypothetical protein